MARIKLLIVGILFALSGMLFAGTYTLTDGSSVTGEPVGYSKDGVILKSGGSYLPRTSWSQFTQESLKQILSETKRPQDAAFIEPFLDDTAEEQQKIKRPITVTQPDRVEMPKGQKGVFAMFGSPLGFLILLLLYAANIYAAYEVALFRYHSIAVCCGLAAVLPLIGPMIMVSIPKPVGASAAPAQNESEPEPGTPEYEAIQALQAQAQAESAQAAAPDAPGTTHGTAVPGAAGPGAEQAPTTPGLPAPVVFRRGEFTFNRRFFETKLPGFLRMVPGQAEKDMVVYIKSARGEFIGRRIMKLTQTDLLFEIFKEGVTADETIPYLEIYEVQIRHKDWA